MFSTPLPKRDCGKGADNTHRHTQKAPRADQCSSLPLIVPPPGARISSGKNDSALRKRLTNSSPLPCVYVSQARVLGITPKANQQRRNRIVIVSCFFCCCCFCFSFFSRAHFGAGKDCGDSAGPVSVSSISPGSSRHGSLHATPGSSVRR